MNQLEIAADRRSEWFEEIRTWSAPTLAAAFTVTVVLMLIVAASKPAWLLLGAGRGFVPEEYYHVWGFVLTLGTVFGQAVGWAGGSAVAFYVMAALGFPPTWATVRLAMSVVYVGLAVLPLWAYHVLYGSWLLGLPRAGLDEWLSANYPGARWFLITSHPIVDYSFIPLAVVFLGLLWWFGERLRQEAILRTALALALLTTSLAVALSLAIHSILVHVRIGT
ncbi:MAG: hypothetical protein HYV04_01005 [Deltaproteobacteria bacterium]|nr:hypothetical protein [Deltaproteobacteria bacterium]